jgi:hypothetical protein
MASNIIPLHRGVAMAAARPVREQGRPPSSAPVLSPIPVEQLRAMFAERSFRGAVEVSRFDGPPRNVEVKPSLRFRAAVTVGLAIVSWGNGPIPNGLLICHHCDNRRCCRPAHLFLGTYADNTADMVGKCRQWQQRKTHCKHGHEFTAENTRTQGAKRHCRECGRIRYRRAYAEGRIGGSGSDTAGEEAHRGRCSGNPGFGRKQPLARAEVWRPLRDYQQSQVRSQMGTGVGYDPHLPKLLRSRMQPYPMLL